VRVCCAASVVEEWERPLAPRSALARAPLQGEGHQPLTPPGGPFWVVMHLSRTALSAVGTFPSAVSGYQTVCLVFY